MSSNSNKTAEVLRLVLNKKVITTSDLAGNKPLLDLFSTSKTTTPRRRIIDTAALLARQGYLSVGFIDNEKLFKITEKGKERLKAHEVTKEGLSIPERWDGRWYLVTFDIPEARKVARNQLILTLKRHGFINYTKGLWIIPYNPTNMIKSLRKQLDIKDEIKMIVAQFIDDEYKYKKFWDL